MSSDYKAVWVDCIMMWICISTADLLIIISFVGDHRSPLMWWIKRHKSWPHKILLSNLAHSPIINPIMKWKCNECSSGMRRLWAFQCLKNTVKSTLFGFIFVFLQPNPVTLVLLGPKAKVNFASAMINTLGTDYLSFSLKKWGNFALKVNCFL